MAWRLGFVESAGEDANGGFVDVEGSEVGGDVDSERSTGDDCASGESEMLGKFLCDRFTLGSCTAGTNDSDFGVVEGFDLALCKEKAWLIWYSLEGLGIVFGMKNSDAIGEGFVDCVGFG